MAGRLTLARSGYRADAFNGGQSRIAGIVTLAPDGTPLARLVRLYDRRAGNLLRETWSDEQGNYSFDWIDGSREYLAYSLDHTGQHNAAIADRPPVEPMP